MLRVMKILIIEDDALTRISLTHIFSSIGQVTCCESYLDFEENQSKNQFDLLLLDLDLESPLLGQKVLKEYKDSFGYCVVLTGHEESQIIQECYELGANDFLCKPFEQNEIESLLKRIKIESLSLKDELKREFSIFESSRLEEIENKLAELSSVSSLLIQGETGTGKTKLAKFIHKNIFDGPFVHINCAEIPENLVESELFGYRRGAFTGANTDKTGKLRLADGGVLFLDEFTALSANLQRKLLVALEEKSYFPIGSNQKESSNFFLISASCDDLDLLRNSGELRDDFYFRIGEASVVLPPLRERQGDFEFLLKKYMNTGRRILLDEEASQMLRQYSWPGNIREFQSVMRRLKSQKNALIDAETLSGLLESKTSVNETSSSFNTILKEAKEHGLSHYLKKIEKEITKRTLNQNKNLVRKTIKDLKLSKSAFYRIINS